MKALLILAIASISAQADSFSDGLERIDSLQKRTKALLGSAGLGEPAGSNDPGQNGSKPRFLRIYSAPSGSMIPAGALAFGQTHLRLLVGDEGSPIQVTFSDNGKYPALSGMKAEGTASQARGRIFAEFNRLITSAGKVIPIKAQLLDRSGALGVKGENEKSKTLEIAGGVGLGLIAAPEENQDTFGFGEMRPQSTSERLRSSLLSETRNYLREQFHETPVIRLDELTGVTLLFKEEVRF